MNIDIRPCAAADAGALALVAQATFLETYATNLGAADLLFHCEQEHGKARYAAWLAEPGLYRFWAAEVAETGVLVGYVMLSPPDLPVPTDPGDLEIKRIYLLSRFQGGGVGARLMRVALEAARREGAPRVLLGVYGENATALTFYARQGFAEAGVRKFQVGASTYDDLVLAKGL
jgi:ribosomal protein S18 acetylase RimI-like enzyme